MYNYCKYFNVKSENMKKLLIAIVLIASMAYAKTIYKKSDLSICNLGFTTENKTTKIANGILKEYYESGELEKETPYKKGKIHGVEKIYYKSGRLLWETPYIDGKKNGVEKSYYASGKLKKEIGFYDDSICGQVVEYSELGKEISRMSVSCSIKK
jgi:antitoxin component YwqK of YwqJK toxin-antitoxin module